MTRSAYHMHLRLLDDSFVFPNLEQVLAPLASSLVLCKDRVDRACRSGRDEWAEAVVDEECDLVEDLLGCSYVVCQAYITCVCSRVVRLYDAIYKQRPNILDKLPRGKKHVLRTCSKSVSGCGYSQVQVLDSFANYFKHRSEWPIHWDRADDLAKGTIKVIRKVGAEEGCSGNMRHGAEALGNDSYNDLNVFIDILGSWRTDLVNEFKDALKASGLLPA